MFAGSVVSGKAQHVAPDQEKKQQTNERTVMKHNILAVIAVASLLAAGTTFAQSGLGTGPRGQGNGYGGPPKSNEERAARQAACLEKNGGVCPQDGVCVPGKGQGNGNGHRRGLRDGTGPRSADGTCPNGNTPAKGGRK